MRIMLLVLCTCLMSGCYTKKVEKVEHTTPERVVIREQPERDIVVRQEEEDPYRKKVRVTEF